ncbi:MAG: DUF503 domain-containing protein [Jiangellaceae bacterium]|nr:DUF503 domain-containing protein [Jiangellaceae bacterium]
MFTGTLSLDLLLGDVRSLKQKRAVIRPIVADLQRRFPVAAAEVGHLDLHRRAELGIAVVAADPGHCHRLLDGAERLVAQRPEVDLLSAHRVIYSSTDEPEGSTTWPTEPAPESWPTGSG